MFLVSPFVTLVSSLFVLLGLFGGFLIPSTHARLHTVLWMSANMRAAEIQFSIFGKLCVGQEFRANLLRN